MFGESLFTLFPALQWDVSLPALRCSGCSGWFAVRRLPAVPGPFLRVVRNQRVPYFIRFQRPCRRSCWTSC